MFTFNPRGNKMYQSEAEWCYYVWYKCQFVMLYLAWDREINISLFFCDVFVWKWGLRPRRNSRCYHSNKVLRPQKSAFLCIPPECLSACKICRGGGCKFPFPKMFDSYRDLFLNINQSMKHFLFWSMNKFSRVLTKQPMR